MRKTKIKSQEEKIFDLLDEGNALAVGAFEKLYTRFEEDDAMHYTCHAAIIRTIYIVRSEHVLWRIAFDHRVGERTLYRYRKSYVKWFCFYFERLAASANSAA